MHSSNDSNHTNPSFSSTTEAPVWLYHSAMLLASFLVATSFPVAKEITPLMDPGVLTAVRFLLATLLFAPYVHRRFGLSWPGGKGLLRYALLSSTLVGFFWLTFLALRYTVPLHTGTLFTIVPGLSGVLSWLLLREKVGTGRVLALFLALFGALWVVLDGHLANILATHFNQGDVIFLVACLCMALYAPLIRLLHRGEAMAVMTFWTMATGTCWLFLFNGPTMITYPWAEVAGKAWLGIVYLALFTTIVTFFITQWATMGLGPTRVSAYSYLYPLLVILLDLIFYQKLPSARIIPGIVIILPAMYLIQRAVPSKK